MAIDFGIKAELFSDEQVEEYLNNLESCMLDSGLFISMDEPGLGSLIKSMIRGLEKAIVTPFEPQIALIAVVMEALEAGVKAPVVFLDKIISVADGLTELVANLPLSIIEFIMDKCIGPFIDNMSIPLPSIEGFIEIINGKVKLADIDWSKWIEDGKLIIPESLKAKGEDIVKKVMTLFQVPIDGNGKADPSNLPIFKILELVLMPIKFAIGMIKSVIDIVKDLVTNIFAAIEKLTEIATDPVGFVLGLIGDVLAPILETLGKVFAPPGADISGLATGIIEFFETLFSNGIKLTSEQLKDISNRNKGFDKILPFVLLIQCLIKWIISILTPDTILGLFFPIGIPTPPPLEIIKYEYKTKTINVDNEHGNANDLYSADDIITFEHTDLNDTFEAIVESSTSNTITIKEDPTDSIDDDTGGGAVTKIN